MDRIKNYLTKDIVLLAPKRLERSNDFKNNKIKSNCSEEDCVFCVQNRGSLENIVFESDDKKAVVIKNKYPAITENIGFHEVIIDSLCHNVNFGFISQDDMKSVFYSIINRVEHFYKNEKVAYVQIFKNSGVHAGASKEHSHMQLMAVDYVPRKIETISRNMTKHKDDKDNCYLCTLIEGKQKFTVYENEYFSAVTMIDTLMSYTIDIIPKRHFNILSEMTLQEVKGLCDVIRVIFPSVDKIIDDLNYNILFYQSPRVNNELNKDFHCFIQIVPRIYGFAGFELSTNNYINSTEPRAYAKKLKENIEK